MSETITIILRPDITYVAGIVNGETVEFVKAEENIWTARVTPAEDNVYEVYIVAYNRSGLSTEFSTTLYYDTKLIFNRTQKDLLLKNDRSYYNATDLNRVESQTHYIETLLQMYSYFNSQLNCKQDWLMTDLPTQTQMRRYLNNIKQLMNAYYLKTTTPQLPPDMDDLTIEEANAIERILYDMQILIENMVSQFNYSGELFSGEV